MSDRLVESLMSPRAYPHPVDAIERHETHISWVFLAGEFAYKVKRPVNFGFVDFSTLERRREFCLEEIRLNGRLAPHLYLEVVPLGPAPGNSLPYVVGGEPALEYAVKMRRFDQNLLLPHVLKQNGLTSRHVDNLAAEVAEFHLRIARAPVDSLHGRPDAVLTPVLECFAPAGKGADAEGRAMLERIREWVTSEHARRVPIFQTRLQDGFVRECHGDMHLGNMLLEGDRVTIFDGIEFSESLRWIDVQSEVAFTVMDLAERGRPDASARFLNAYLEHTGDYAGLNVLRFYSVYRAMVRAKVAGLRLEQSDLSPGDRATEEAKRQGYIRLALSMTEPPAPRLYLTHGLSGAGKSTWTQLLIELLPGIRVRSDVERKRLAGLKPMEPSHSGLNEALYSRKNSARTYDRLLEAARQIIESGYPAVVDATFLTRAARDRFRTLAREVSAEFRILDFQAPEKVLRERIAARAVAGSDPSEATLAVLDEQLRHREPLSEEEFPHVIPIDATRRPNWDSLLGARAPACRAES